MQIPYRYSVMRGLLRNICEMSSIAAAFARVVNFIFLEFCGKLKILFFRNFAAVKQFLRQRNADDFAAVGGKVQVAVRACADMAESFV